jgi:hypothetical protein
VDARRLTGFDQKGSSMAKTIAATVTKVTPDSQGTGHRYIGTLKPDTSYESGGDTITKASSPEYTLPEKIDMMLIQPSGGYLAEWIPSTGKVKLYVGPASAKEPQQEVAAAKDISAITFPFICWGA